jgi:dTDP-glucose pyrophosphorylase
MVRDSEVVAVLPAAGLSRRLVPLPCSKEILPVGFGKIPGIQGHRPKVASHYLLECLREAGVRKGFMVIRRGKWDIPAYWSDGSLLGMHLAYVPIDGSAGPPDTIDRAYPFIKNNIVAFGFPDILFRPRSVFRQLLARLDYQRSDVVLALFRAHDTKQMDMVEVDERHRVSAIYLKPKSTRLKYAWLCAVWTPIFTEFLHGFLHSVKSGSMAKLVGNRKIDPQGDIPVGAVLRAAIHAKIQIEGVMFPTGRYIDIGTPQALSTTTRIVL